MSLQGGFQEVVSLEADVTFSLGKLNKKTGKTDPKSVEGYYLGNREIDTKLGKSLIHFFKGPKGNVAVWGSTNLNHKLAGVQVGTMTKVEFVGMKPTPRGEMRAFKVFQDKNNILDAEISTAAPVSYADEEDGEGYQTESDLAGNDDDEAEARGDGAYENTAIAAAQISAAERQAKVQALLKSKAAKK